MLEKIMTLIKQKDTCVLATTSEGHPHCSLMSYIADGYGRSFFMASSKNTKKYVNLMKNRTVSLLIDNRDDGKNQSGAVTALTVKGIFQPITDDARKEEILRKLLERHPSLKEFASDRETAVFEIKAEAFELLEGISKASYFSLE